MVARQPLLLLAEHGPCHAAVSAAITESLTDIEPAVWLPPAARWAAEGALSVVIVYPLGLAIFGKSAGVGRGPRRAGSKPSLHPGAIGRFPFVGPPAGQIGPGLILRAVHCLEFRLCLGGRVVVGKKDYRGLGNPEHAGYGGYLGRCWPCRSADPLGPTAALNAVRSIPSRKKTSPRAIFGVWRYSYTLFWVSVGRLLHGQVGTADL